MKLRIVSAAMSLALALSLAAPAGAGVTRTDRRNARLAAGWITSQQEADGSFLSFSTIGSTADGVLALAAARRGAGAIEDALDFLADSESEVDAPGEIAKVAMAWTAGGRDPRQFAGRDLVTEIDASAGPDGRYGMANDFSQVFDQALSILALVAAGETPPQQATRWLVDAQCPDGGWQFDRPADATEDEHCSAGEGDFNSSDTNTTAMAVQALMVVPGAPMWATSPFRFFRAIRDRVGKGWGFTWGFETTDANSTSLVIQAYVAAGKALPKRSKKALRRLQYDKCSKHGPAFAFTYEDSNSDGSYSLKERTGPDLGATTAAVLGLLEKPFPLRFRPAKSGTPSYGCVR